MGPQELVDVLTHMMYVEETLDPHSDIALGRDNSIPLSSDLFEVVDRKLLISTYEDL